MNPVQFVSKWSRAELPERAASQEHFIDLCRLLGQPTPAEHDATGAEYTFEKSVVIRSWESKGQRGYADVWWRGKFAWEYKRKDKYDNLDEAYRQLCKYRDALQNPPLLIVSDIARIHIHTNFTGTIQETHLITLEDLPRPDNLDKLRRVFTDPDSFKPTLTRAKVTESAAAAFAKIAAGLRDRGHDPYTAAHFLMKCMFCLFAEDVGLLTTGLFKRLLTEGRKNPKKLALRMNRLFEAMRAGGDFGADDIGWFNGGLFDSAPALELTDREISDMLVAAEHDWAAVEPAIFGTLFERSLDPGKRAQIGAHYTSREDILLVVEPVVMAALRDTWRTVQANVEGLLSKRREQTAERAKDKINQEIGKALEEFLHHLATIRILDPACGSGNFLYVAIQQLLDLEKEVVAFAAQPEIELGLFPRVRPTQLHGIEINPYAAELAQVVAWIGYLQWMRDNGFKTPSDPILEPLQTIECRDAVLDLSDPARPAPANWPEADFIIGNPPFLGSKLFRRNGLEDTYVQETYSAFDLPRSSDLCCYWFELARRAVERKPDTRVGLLATQGIRGSDNRVVLERIKKTGDIFMAWSDREWTLDGAAVHVSIIGFDSGRQTARILDGQPAAVIHADLSATQDRTTVQRLIENTEIYVRSPEKGARFEVTFAEALGFLRLPNPNGRSSFDVLRPWINGQGLVAGRPTHWIIDFHGCADEKAAAGYEAVFQHVLVAVRGFRSQNRYKGLRSNWWRFRRPGDGVRDAARRLPRLLGTTMVAKHRLFAWIPRSIQPDKTIPVFARDDDYFFGVLHSSIHELWALRMGTQLEDRPRYTPTTCFETFPMPWPPGKEPTDHSAHRAISAAARELNELRERWLNPPEWIEPLAEQIDREDDFADQPVEIRPLVRQSAIMAAAAKDSRLKKRTLTKLYNERPAWLRLAHHKLDQAVLSAYAAVDPEGGWSTDWADVWVETGAGQPLPEDHLLAERRRELDGLSLAALLRLNLDRAAPQ